MNKAESLTQPQFGEEGSTNLEKMLDRIKLHIVEKSSFAKPLLAFSVDYHDIPPVIPTAQRKYELNTESEKKSIYLKKDAARKGKSYHIVGCREVKPWVMERYCKITQESNGYPIWHY